MWDFAPFGTDRHRPALRALRGAGQGLGPCCGSWLRLAGRWGTRIGLRGCGPFGFRAGELGGATARERRWPSDRMTGPSGQTLSPSRSQPRSCHPCTSRRQRPSGRWSGMRQVVFGLPKMRSIRPGTSDHRSAVCPLRASGPRAPRHPRSRIPPLPAAPPARPVSDRRWMNRYRRKLATCPPWWP